MLHQWFVVWFQWVQEWGYKGVFLLMALESSIIPVPSEIVMPPAAYWAAQGKMDFWGVVIAGTLGSYFGSAVSYGLARLVGKPFLERYGKYILLSPAKINIAEAWVAQYGKMGIFLSRLLPVIRHLISLPAGILKMNFFHFSWTTLTGAFVWCWILSGFGKQVIGDQPDLLNSPEQLVLVCKQKLLWFVGGIFVFALTYFLFVYLKRAFQQPKSTID